MIIRSCFVSNSSSSSFIIAIPNYNNKPLEERVSLETIDDRIRDEEEWLKTHPNYNTEDLDELKQKKAAYIDKARDENLVIMDVVISTEEPIVDGIEKFLKRIGSDIKILDEDYF